MARFRIIEEAVRKIERIPCERRYNRYQLLENILNDVYQAGRAYERERTLVLCESELPDRRVVQTIKRAIEDDL